MQKVRSIFVLCVVVLLLCGAPMAAACGMACNQATASCASAATTHMAMSMECEHCRKQAAWNTQHCATTACAPMALLRERQEDHVLHAQAQPPALTEQAIAFQLMPQVPSWRTEPPKTPPVSSSLFVPLRI